MLRAWVRHSFILLMMVLLTALAGCKVVQSEGRVQVLDYSDTPYAVQGAKVTLFRLTPATALPGGPRSTVGVGRIADDDGGVTLYVRESALNDGQWYGIEVRCPARAQRGRCELVTPLHAVVSGAMVNSGGWQVTALTEVAFHEVAYGVAAGFEPAEIRQVLDNTAHKLLASPDDPDYDDLLAWDPQDSTALRRPEPLTQLNIALGDGITTNALKLLIQQWTAVRVGGLRLGEIGDEAVESIDLALQGRYAYVARGGARNTNGLDVIELNDPQRPVRVAKWDLPGYERLSALALQDDTVFLTGNTYSDGYVGVLRVINVQDPLRPDSRCDLELPEFVTDVAVAGRYVFVTQQSTNRVQTVDLVTVLDEGVEIPGCGAVGSGLTIANGAQKLQVAGNRLWALGTEGVTILNIDDPVAPVLVGELPLAGGALALALADNLAYVGDAAGVMHVVDISTESAPVLLASVDMRSASGESLRNIQSIQLSGANAYVAGGWMSGVHRIDLSDPLAPQWVKGIQLDRNSTELALAHGLIYSASNSGLQIVSGEALLSTPVLAGQLDVPGGLSDKTVASARGAFSPRSEDIMVISLDQPRVPTLLAEYFWSNVACTALSGSYAYFGTESGAGVRVVDVSDPAVPIELSIANFDVDELFGMRSVAAAGQNIYVSWGFFKDDSDTGQTYRAGGLYVFDARNITDVVLAAHLPFPGHASALAAAGQYAYVVVEGRQFNVVNATDLQAPVVMGSVILPATVETMVMVGDFAYAASGDGGVQVIDVSDPTRPRLVRVVDTAGSAAFIAVADGYAYVADGPGGVLALDLADPANPAIIGNIDVRDSVRTLFVQHDLVYPVTSQGLDVLKKPDLASD